MGELNELRAEIERLSEDNRRIGELQSINVELKQKLSIFDRIIHSKRSKALPSLPANVNANALNKERPNSARFALRTRDRAKTIQCTANTANTEKTESVRANLPPTLQRRNTTKPKSSNSNSNAMAHSQNRTRK